MKVKITNLCQAFPSYPQRINTPVLNTYYLSSFALLPASSPDTAVCPEH